MLAILILERNLLNSGDITCLVELFDRCVSDANESTHGAGASALLLDLLRGIQEALLVGVFACILGNTSVLESSEDTSLAVVHLKIVTLVANFIIEVIQRVFGGSQGISCCGDSLGLGGPWTVTFGNEAAVLKESLDGNNFILNEVN